MFKKSWFSRRIYTYPLFNETYNSNSNLTSQDVLLDIKKKDNNADFKVDQLLLFTQEDPSGVRNELLVDAIDYKRLRKFNTGYISIIKDLLLLINFKIKQFLALVISCRKYIISSAKIILKIPNTKIAGFIVNLLLFTMINAGLYSVVTMDINQPIPRVTNNINTVNLEDSLSKQYKELNKLVSSDGNVLSLSQVAAPDSYFQISSWVPWWSLASGLDNAIAHKASSKDISLFLYNIDKDGNLEIKNKSIPEDVIVKRVHLSGEKVFITITEDANASTFVSLLKDDNKRLFIIDQIIEKSKIYDGVDLDFEALQFSATDQEKRDLKILYPEFVAELRDKLHLDNKKLSVTVGARTGREDPNWSVYDYQSLAVVSDQIKVMAYDYHNLSSAPGPLTSQEWIENILDYMLSSIKPEKITIGLPTYGYRWGSDNSEVALTGEQINNILKTNKGEITRDMDSNTPMFSYTKNNISYKLYYVDSIFYTAILESLRSNNVNQIALWSVGTEDQSIWNLFTIN